MHFFILIATSLVAQVNGGNYTIKSVDGGASVAPTGKCERFFVDSKIDGHSTLDASKLEATEIEIKEKIDGGSTVKLNLKTSARLHFEGKVDGQSG